MTFTAAQTLQLASVVLGLWFVEGVLVDASGLFNLCVADAPHGSSLVSELLFYGAVAALLLAVGLACTASSTALQWKLYQPQRWFAVAFLFVWWYCTFLAMQVASATIGDTTCHRRHKHNAVSGHYGFFLFWNLAALWLLRASVDAGQPDANYLAPALLLRAWRSKNAAHRLMAACVAVLLACSALTLFRTWFLGYHSLRQCVLGAAVAVASHYLVANALDHVVYGRSASARTWARTWALRLVAVLLVATAVAERLITGSTSIDLGVAVALLVAGAVCVAAPPPQPPAVAATKKKL